MIGSESDRDTFDDDKDGDDDEMAGVERESWSLVLVPYQLK